MICPYCGKENVDRAPFCADCGKSLAGVYDSVAKNKSTSDMNTESVSDEMVANASSVESVEVVSVDNGVNIPPHSDAANNSTQETVSETVVEPVSSATVSTTESTSTEQAPDSVTEPTQASGAATAAQAASAAAPDSTAQTVPPAQAASTAQVGAQYQQVPQPNSYAAQARPVYAKGCVGAAWSDITSSQGWFKKILLLGLIMCVPILNFYVIGYCMRWARQLVLGKIEHAAENLRGRQLLAGLLWIRLVIRA